MKYKIQEKLLKGCGIRNGYYSQIEHKWITCGGLLNSGKRVYCPECKSKLQQHEETSKAKDEKFDKILDELKVDKIYNNFIVDMDTYDDELRVQEMIVHVIKEIKQRIKEDLEEEK